MPKNTTTPQDQKTLLEESFKQRQNAMSYANLYKTEIKETVQAINNSLTTAESSSSESTSISVNGIKTTGSVTVQTITESTNIYCSATTNSSTEATENQSSATTDSPTEATENQSSATSESSNIADITVLEDIDSMWRIENVQHQFNDGKPGFYSILALTNPY
jgi:hypothetical protein